MKLLLLLLILLSVNAPAISQSARMFDQYHKPGKEDLANRLDNFAIELQNDPTTRGYIISYGAPSSNASVAESRARFAENYLVETRGIFTDRLLIIRGGLRKEPVIELWIVPSGAKPPAVSPPARTTPAKDKKN